MNSPNIVFFSVVVIFLPHLAAQARGELIAKVSTPHPGPLLVEEWFFPDDPHPACGHLLPLPRAKDRRRGSSILRDVYPGRRGLRLAGPGLSSAGLDSPSGFSAAPQPCPFS